MSDAFRFYGKVASSQARGAAGIAETLKDAGATVVGTIRASVDRVVGELGRIDVLVNSAGVNVPQGVLEADETRWRTVMDANLKDAFFASQAGEVGITANVVAPTFISTGNRCQPRTCNALSRASRRGP